MKLSRELKMKYKSERSGDGRNTPSWEIPREDKHGSKRTSKEKTTRQRQQRRQQHHRTRYPKNNPQTKKERYRSKSADSIFSRTNKQRHQEYGALIPYRPTNTTGDDTMDYYAKYYDNDEYYFWEEELYKSNFDDLPPCEEGYSYEDDDDVTPEFSLNSTPKYVNPGDDEWDGSEEKMFYSQYDPVNSPQGSLTYGRDGDVDDDDDRKNRGEEMATKKKKKQQPQEEDFGVSLSVNDLEEKSIMSGSSSGTTTTTTSGKNPNNSAGPSFIVPPPHSEVRANMPSFPFAPKPSPGPSKNKLIRDAVAHATSLRDVYIEPSSKDDHSETISEMTNPTYAPPLHSKVRAKKPKNKSDDSSSGLEGGANTDVVSEVTMPSTIENLRFVPPLLSEVLKRKPADSMSASLGEESSGAMDEPTEDGYRKQPQQTKEPIRSKSDFTPPPPPPRPPPPRGRVTKPSLNKTRKSTHPSGSTPSQDSFEDVAARSHLPPLKEESPNVSASPIKSQEYEPKQSKSSKLSATVVQLNNAAAELLLMHGMSKSPGHSPNTPSRNDLARSYSQPNASSNDLPFNTLSRMHSQPNCGPTPHITRASSARFNNSYSGGLLMHPENMVKRSRRVEQMPFTDDFGDSGLYTGEVNEDARPNGQGRMKYENGVFFEGKWVNGVREGNIAQRERILSGFSSWKGSGKKGGGNVVVHGMAWIDRFGKAGQYTGDVNEHSNPHGKGVMKYDFGLIAEGEWVNGVLIDGSQQPILGGAGGMAVAGGSVFPGGATLGMGGISTVGPAFPQQPMMMNPAMGNAYGNQGGHGGPPTFIRKQTDNY